MQKSRRTYYKYRVNIYILKDVHLFPCGHSTVLMTVHWVLKIKNNHAYVDQGILPFPVLPAPPEAC